MTAIVTYAQTVPAVTAKILSPTSGGDNAAFRTAMRTANILSEVNSVSCAPTSGVTGRTIAYTNGSDASVFTPVVWDNSVSNPLANPGYGSWNQTNTTLVGIVYPGIAWNPGNVFSGATDNTKPGASLFTFSATVVATINWATQGYWFTNKAGGTMQPRLQLIQGGQLITLTNSVYNTYDPNHGLQLGGGGGSATRLFNPGDSIAVTWITANLLAAPTPTITGAVYGSIASVQSYMDIVV
jgi:hypothetical protein